jgi:ectoine hydroxylase-related dioxygenase (phytanoyl-CoA dioxygenase family)
MTTIDASDLQERLATHRRELDEQGYTIVEHAIDEEMVDEVRRAVDRLEEAVGGRVGQDRFRGRSTIKIQNLLAKDAVFRRLAMNEMTRHLAEHVLGPGFLLSTVQSMDILPGELHQPIHVDDMYYGSMIGRPHLPVACNTVWAIDDFTADNGATVVVPGSHLWDDAPGANIDEIIARVDELPEGRVSAVMPKGSVVVFHGALWHGGGANTSSGRRIAIAVNHCSGWIRPEHNNTLIIPTDVVRTFEPELQVMLGFGVYERVIGRIDGMAPLEALALEGR